MTEQEYQQHIRDLCLAHGATRVVLFGSRARGTNSPRSDFDLAVYGLASTEALQGAIDDLPTLFSADVVNMETCLNPYLIQEVEAHGVRL